MADIHGLKDHRAYVKSIVNGYDLVGLTAMSFQYQEALALADELRMTRAVLAGNEPERAVPESREFYWSKVRRCSSESLRLLSSISKTATMGADEASIPSMQADDSPRRPMR